MIRGVAAVVVGLAAAAPGCALATVAAADVAPRTGWTVTTRVAVTGAVADLPEPITGPPSIADRPEPTVTPPQPAIPSAAAVRAVPRRSTADRPAVSGKPPQPEGETVTPSAAAPPGSTAVPTAPPEPTGPPAAEHPAGRPH
jgi:hypothetical protein